MSEWTRKPLDNSAVVKLFQGDEPPCPDCQRLRELCGELWNAATCFDGRIEEFMSEKAYKDLTQRVKAEGVEV